MPTYEYECPACGRFAALGKLAQYDLPAACPDCGQPAPRAISAPAWTGPSARQRRYDGASGTRRAVPSPLSQTGYAGPAAGGVTPDAAGRSHGLSCACCGPAPLRQAMANAKG